MVTKGVLKLNWKFLLNSIVTKLLSMEILSPTNDHAICFLKQSGRILLLYFCIFFIEPHLHAQEKGKAIASNPSKNSTVGEMMRSLGNPNLFLNGDVEFNGKLLPNGMQSISLLPIDSIKTISVIKRSEFPFYQNILGSSLGSENDLIIINTSKELIDSIKLPWKQ